MPIINHSHAPEVPWRPGYRKWDIAGHEQGVSSTLSINTAEPGTGAPAAHPLGRRAHRHPRGNAGGQPRRAHAHRRAGPHGGHTAGGRARFPRNRRRHGAPARVLPGAGPVLGRAYAVHQGLAAGGVAAGVRDGGCGERGAPFDRLRANGVVKGGVARPATGRVLARSVEVFAIGHDTLM